MGQRTAGDGKASGWTLVVVPTEAAGQPFTWPEYAWPRAGGIPTVDDRDDALSALGYVVTGDAWRWTEATAPDGRVILTASVPLKRKPQPTDEEQRQALTDWVAREVHKAA